MVHELFGMANDGGLSGALINDRVGVAKFLRPPEEPNLRVLTAGDPPPNPAELLASKQMTRILDALLTQADMIVIDTPPLLAVTDAAVLAPAVDGTILVVSAKHTKRAAARTASATLEGVGGRRLGVVLVSLKGNKGEEAYDSYRYSSKDDGAEAVSSGTI
jgi:non-specific protein-tyrosine kinase